MIIDHLFIRAFGGLENFELNFSSAMQIIYGINESGKTTIQNFIKVMFYGFGKIGHSIETNDRKKYQPWNREPMGGYILFSHQGLSYRLEKQFADRKSLDKTRLYYETSGELVNLKNSDQPGKELFKISETEFMNTVFVEKTFLDNENLYDIDRKIGRNIGLAEYDWSYEEIKQRLDKARKYYQSDRGKDGYLLKLEQRIADLNLGLEQALDRDHEISRQNLKIDSIEQNLLELDVREKSLQMQNQQHQKLKLADRFEKYKKLEKVLNQYKQFSSEDPSNVLKNKSISAKELTEIANQRQKTAQALSEFEIRQNIADQKSNEQENYRLSTKQKISTIVEERSRLQYLKQKTSEKDPQTFTKPEISYGSFIPLVIAEVFCLIGGLISRSINPILSGILIVLAVLLPFIMVFVYYFLQRRYENQIKQYHSDIRKYEMRTIKIENDLQKLEWEVDQIEQRIRQMNFDQLKTEEVAEVAWDEYQKELKELRYLIKPYFSELPDDNQLEAAIQFLREQTVENIHNEEEIERIQEQMQELRGDYKVADFYQAYQDSQNWLSEKHGKLRTFPEFSESHIASQLRGIQETRLHLREDLAAAKANLMYLSQDHTSTIELEVELERFNQEFNVAELNHQALLVALRMLEYGRSSFDQDIRPQLNQKAAEYLSAMTGDHYKDLKIDRDYRVRLQSDFEGNSDFYEQAFYSSGLNDQINLALRLAITDLLQDSNGIIPLILDDPFTQLDEKRAELSLNLLKKVSEKQKRQIILFTSQNSLLTLAENKIDTIHL